MARVKEPESGQSEDMLAASQQGGAVNFREEDTFDTDMHGWLLSSKSWIRFTPSHAQYANCIHMESTHTHLARTTL